MNATGEHYRPPPATINRSENLILHDGILFDSRHGRMICKFDKLADYLMSGTNNILQVC